MAEPALDIKKLNVKKLPVWVWVAAGGGAIVLVYVILRNNASAATDTPAPASSGGGASDALAAVSGFSQQLDQLRTGIQAQIAALTDDQRDALRVITDSINASITSITARIATLTTGQDAIRAALSAAVSRIDSLGAAFAERGADNVLKVQQYNAIIEELRDQIESLTRNNPVTAVAIAAAFDQARLQLAIADTINSGGNYQVSRWFRATDNEIQTKLRSDSTLMVGSPARALIVAVVRNQAGQWTLPGSSVSWSPLPVATNPLPPPPV